MSILIEDMEMPITHPLTVIIYTDGTVADVYGGGKARAVSLPSHRDLIERDALIKEIDKLAKGWGGLYRLMLDTAIERVKAAPTILAAEEV